MTLPNHHRITISTLSPIHVGCDEVYVPSNFVIKDNLLHQLDMAVIADELDASERSALGSKQTVGAIQQFFKAKRDRFAPLASHMVEVVEGIAREYEDKAGKTTQQGPGGEVTYNLFPIARTAYRAMDDAPYLPGSSLKGSIRTAWLDAINHGEPLKESGKNANHEMQQRLLGYKNGKFQDDPLRHLQVADAHHGEEVGPAPARILYAASKKKRPSERGTSKLYVYLETIPAMLDDAFSGEIRLTGNKISWRNLCDACNNFYWPQLDAELTHAHLAGMMDQGWLNLMKGLFADELKIMRENHQGFLLRVGRHSGAESVTLNGVRNIKILGKPGDPPTYRPETTEKRFASQTRAAVDGLMPFGWLWVECCEDQYQHVSIAARAKLKPHAHKLRSVQRDRQSTVDEARLERAATAKAALILQHQAQQAEQRKLDEQQARMAVLESMNPNLRHIEELRAEIEQRLASGKKITVSDQFYGQRIKTFALQALDSSEWSADEKIALADMLQDWAGKLVALDAKDLRKQLKLNALRGQL